MSALIPPWILDDAWRDLTPPAIVLKLGSTRSPENLLAASRSLFVTTARRYQSDASGTKCNIYLSDVLQILAAPIPHRFDLGDRLGFRELRANDIVDGLRASKFDGWNSLESIYSGSGGVVILDNIARIRAAQGLPTIAVWKNTAPMTDASGRILKDAFGRIRYHSGHVVLVVPSPPGKVGVYVTGAGMHCVDQCPIAQAFGPYLQHVEYFVHE